MININISRKHLIVLVLILVVATYVNYTIAQTGEQSHPPGEIDAGSFASGTYTFPSKLVAAEMCIPSDIVGNCKTSWPSGGSEAFTITAEAWTTDNCETKCGNLALTCAFGIGDNKLEACGETFGSNRVVRCACWP